MDRLLGLNLKMTRANEQVDWVFKTINAFMDGDPYAVEKYFDPKTSNYVYRGRIRDQPRPEWSIPISEALHHYNSALDNMAWLIADRDGSGAPKGTYFPIQPTGAKFRGLWTRDSGYYMVRGMPPQAQAIIEDAQPYHRGKAYAGHPLWTLRRLANEDKHQALHPVASSMPVIETEVLETHGVVVPKIHSFRGPFKDGAVVLRMPTPRLLPGQVPAEAVMNMNIRFAFGVAFPQDGPGNGRDVRTVLEEIQNAVEIVLRQLLPFVNQLEDEPTITPAPSEIRLEN